MAFALTMTFQELKAEGHELDLVCDLFEGLWGVSHAVVQSFELDSALCQLYRQRREAGTASNHAEYDLCPRHFVGRKGGFDDDLGVKVIKGLSGKAVRTAQPDPSSAALQLYIATMQVSTAAFFPAMTTGYQLPVHPPMSALRIAA